MKLFWSILYIFDNSVGLMISALAQAYDALRDEKYLELAEGAAKFIKDRLYDPDKKKLLRSFREEPGEIDGFVDDYR